MLPSRLYALVAVGILMLIGASWGGHKLYRAGYDAAVLEQNTNEQLIQAASLASQTAAAKAISEIQVKHVTIRQNLEKELTRDVVYRDCVASPRVLELTNEAITGQSDPSSDRVVPTPEPVD